MTLAPRAQWAVRTARVQSSERLDRVPSLVVARVALPLLPLSERRRARHLPRTFVNDKNAVAMTKRGYNDKTRLQWQRDCNDKTRCDARSGPARLTARNPSSTIRLAPIA